MRLIDYQRLKAPQAQQGVLVEPAPNEILALLDSSGISRFRGARILDHELEFWRDSLARELGLARPVIATGHQAEFFHAGVLAKNIAAAAIAERFGQVGVFVLVDADTPKNCQVSVPSVTDGEVSRAAVAIPGCADDVPVEALPAIPSATWRDFFGEMAAKSATKETDTLGHYAAAFLKRADAVDFAASVAAGNGAIEVALDAQPLRVIRMGPMCDSAAFRAFAAASILDARRLAESYNAAQAEYRARHHVRTAQRPVPPLEVAGDRIELPFWLQRGSERRRRVSVLREQEMIQLLADETVVARRVEKHWQEPPRDRWEFERQGWRLRPRALTLSAFLRLFLADVFLHGIGGAKYDEVTEGFIQTWLGVSPGPMMCVTSTLRLELVGAFLGGDDWRAAQGALRDARFNPQRHFDLSGAQRARHRLLVSSGLALRDEYRRGRRAQLDLSEIRRRRKELHGELAQCRAAALEEHRGDLVELEAAAARARRAQEQRNIAEDREYFFALHALADLREMADRIRGALA